MSEQQLRDFFFTFGQGHYSLPHTIFHHPTHMASYWVRIRAINSSEARAAMCNWAEYNMGDPKKWAFEYSNAEEFKKTAEEYYPNGEVTCITVEPPEPEPTETEPGAIGMKEDDV